MLKVVALTAFPRLPVIRGFAAALQCLPEMSWHDGHRLQRMKNRKGFKARSS